MNQSFLIVRCVVIAWVDSGFKRNPTTAAIGLLLHRDAEIAPSMAVPRCCKACGQYGRSRSWMSRRLQSILMGVTP